MDSAEDVKLRMKQRQLEKRRLARLWFYWHLAVFFLLNLLSSATYLLYSLIEGHWLYPWLLWPLAPLGALLGCHYLAVFVLGEDFRLGLIARELQKQGLLNSSGPYGAQYLKAYTQAEQKMRSKLRLYWHLAISVTLTLLSVVCYVLTSWTSGSWYYPWIVWVIEGLAAIFLCHLLWFVLYWGSARQNRIGKGLNT